MSKQPDDPIKPTGRVVRAEALAVAPEVLGRPLAAPWRRLAAMGIDVVAVGLLSLLSTPFLALGTGFLLFFLLGNRADVPLAMKPLRWICRGAGLALIAVALLSLGHVSSVQSRDLNLEALTGRAKSPALTETVPVRPDASMSELRTANERLRRQVEALKEAHHELERAGGSWLYQLKTFSGTLGVTFGWSGIYFTLAAGLWRGRTLGKFLLRIRVRKLDGGPLTFFDAFIRHGGYVAAVAMGMMGFLKLLWDPNRQAVEDRIAGTVVLRE